MDVNYDSGNIIIKYNRITENIPINNFKYFSIVNDVVSIKEVNDNNDYGNFITAQKQLRALDMMKDGSVSPPSISGSVLEIAYNRRSF